MDAATLSFFHLVEAHVFRSLRIGRSVPLALRQALAYAERELSIKHLLVREELRTSPFLDRYVALLNLPPSAQLAVRKRFEAHLTRLSWDEAHLAVRLYPFVFGEGADAKPIVIDPTIAFGKPVVDRAFVSTRTILERIDAGEPVEEVAADYDLRVGAVEEAVLFERAA